MRCDQIGVQVSRQEFVDFLNGIQPGQFFHIKGYKSQNDDGKVSEDPETLSDMSDYWVRWGIKYSNFKARDVVFLNNVLAGNKTFNLRVSHGVWIPNEMLSQGALFTPEGQHDVWATAQYNNLLPGASNPSPVVLTGHMSLFDTVKFSNQEGSGKTYATLTYELSSNHPLVIAAIGAPDLKGTLLQGLVNPKKVGGKDYDKEAQSFFSRPDKDGRIMWYIRDVAVVSSKLVRPGVHNPTKSSLPLTAIKDHIKAKMLVCGKYRQFILNTGNFTSINIAGQAILVDGMDEKTYFALPEIVKEFAEVSAVV